MTYAIKSRKRYFDGLKRSVVNRYKFCNQRIRCFRSRWSELVSELKAKGDLSSIVFTARHVFMSWEPRVEYLFNENTHFSCVLVQVRTTDIKFFSALHLALAGISFNPDYVIKLKMAPEIEFSSPN